MDAAAGSPVGIRNPLLRVLVYGHVWLALGAAAQVWWISSFFGSESLVPALFAASATFSAYGCMRLFRMNTPGMLRSEHMTWFRRNRWTMTLFIAVSGMCAMALGWPMFPRFSPALLLACAFTIFYVLPDIGHTPDMRGLRRIPFLKSFLIAYVWAAMSVLVARAGIEEPMIADGRLMLLVVQFCFFLAMAIVFDVRDTAFDPAAIRSIPQVIGDRATRFVVVVLMVIPILIVAMYFLATNMDGDTPVQNEDFDPTYIGTLIGYIVAATLFSYATPQRSALYYGLLLDGMLILIPVLAWMGSLL